MKNYLWSSFHLVAELITIRTPGRVMMFELATNGFTVTSIPIIGSQWGKIGKVYA